LGGVGGLGLHKTVGRGLGVSRRLSARVCSVVDGGPSDLMRVVDVEFVSRESFSELVAKA
jgi:hypothetical protein